MKAGVAAGQAIGKVVTPYGKAIIYAGRYPAGGAIAVQLIADDALPESIARFSTNLVPYGAQLAEEEFCVKTWSENTPLVGPMLATGLFEDTGKRFASGFVVAPVWRIKDPARVPALQPMRTSSNRSRRGDRLARLFLAQRTEEIAHECDSATQAWAG